MELLPPRPAREDKPCLFEETQVLHDSDASHVHLRLKFGQSTTLTLKEEIEQQPPRWIGKCLEHKVVVHIHDYT